MPVHRVSAASLHEDLQDIQRKQGERVKSISSDPFDPEFFLVYTEYLGLETRATVDGAPL